MDGAAGPFPRSVGAVANGTVLREYSRPQWRTGVYIARQVATSESAYSAGSGRYSALGCAKPTRAQMERPTSSASSTPKASTTPNRERKSRTIVGSFRVPFSRVVRHLSHDERRIDEAFFFQRAFVAKLAGNVRQNPT